MDKNEKNEKKNYSIIIAIALISLLVVAMICIGCSKRTVNDNESNINSGDTQNITSGEVLDNPILINGSDYLPDLEVNTEKDEEGNKINVSPNINNEKMTFDFIDLTNISLKYADGITDFKANIINNSDTDYENGLGLKITFLDNEGRYIHETQLLTSSLKAHEMSNLQARLTKDCSYADTFTIEIIE